ncbi:MAG TPA: TatD family hydrolase [Thermoanaerobaculia bacterium]
MPIFDNHIHLRSEFRGVEAAKDFERAGGTAILLTHSPYDEIPIRRAEDFDEAYAKTLAMGDAVRKATRLQVFVALGPYPVEFLRLREAIGPSAAIEVMRSGIDRAARVIASQEAVAFGEVGRPHFPVSELILAECNRLLEYTMVRAKELGCAVVLHTEDPTPATFAEFARMAFHAGLPPERVVKHHSTPLTKIEDTHGLVPSILAKETLVAEAIKGGSRFLLETDYIDDPRRPGAVLGPATVAKKTRMWMESHLLSEEACHRIHKDLPEKTYGFALDA